MTGAEPEQIEVVGEAADATDPSQVTVVPVDDSFPATADVAMAVERAPGTVVRRLGGLGDLAEVGIRGSSARHTAVLIDGLPLNPEGGSVDLSELPLAGFERVEVYRGTSPLLLGATSLGGAVQLVTGTGTTSSGAIGGGNFGTGHGSATIAGHAGPAHVWFSADGLVTAGNFPYFDDNGTVFDDADDGTSIRENNDVRRLVTVARATVGDVTLLHVGTWSEGGVPGFTFAPAEAVRSGLTRNLAGLAWEHDVGTTLLTARLHGLLREDRLDDPLDEIGVGSGSTADRTRTAGANVAFRTALAPRLRLEGLADLRDDAFRSDDLESGAQGATSGRLVGRLGVGGTWGTPRLAVVPGLVAVATRSRGVTTDDLTTVLPRVGGVARVGGTAFSANAGTFVRPPDPLELFGDRGALVGNPELRAERGSQVDLGARWAWSAAYAELVGFASWNRDLVAWVQNAQGVARPENLANTFVGGVEAAGGWTGDGAELTANLTAVRAVDTDSSLSVPRVPAFELAAVGALTPGPVRLGADVSLTAGTFADRANVVLQPPRVLLGTTFTLRRGPLALELDIRNVLDERTAQIPRDPLVDDGVQVPAAIVDFTGYPLPGRTFLLSVRWRT